MKTKYLTILLAIIGILLLYYISLFTHPTPIDLKDIHTYEGKEITTTGIVQAYRSTSYGNQFITIQQNNSTATVFLEEPINVFSGDLIQATGMVQKYENTWEIIIDHPQQISILMPWNHSATPLWEVAQNPSIFSNMNLNITGYIDSTFDTHFYITDFEGNHTLLVTHPLSKKISTYPGQQVRIHGYFTYNDFYLRYQLELNKDYHNIILLEEA